MAYKNRFIIFENLSVSEIVGKMTKDLTKQLISKVDKQKYYIAKGKNVLFKKGIMNFNCREYLQHLNNLQVIYCVYYLKNEAEYELYDRAGMLNCSADYENGNIKLSLAYVQEQPKDFKISIRHELKHIYQYDCGAKKNINFYETVVDRYKNGEQWEKIVAWALYLSFKTEQDAFISQYYEFLKNNNISKVKLQKNDNNPYYRFDKAFDNVDNIDIDEESLKQRFGINLTQLYSILNAADERLYKKMTNVWTKYVNEKKIKLPNTEEMNFLMECYHRGIHEETDDLIW